jgi:hypothetical protein
VERREAGADDLGTDLVSVDAVGLEAEADWDSLWSPENYLGSDRTENLEQSVPGSASCGPAIGLRADIAGARAGLVAVIAGLKLLALIGAPG